TGLDLGSVQREAQILPILTVSATVTDGGSTTQVAPPVQDAALTPVFSNALDSVFPTASTPAPRLDLVNTVAALGGARLPVAEQAAPLRAAALGGDGAALAGSASFGQANMLAGALNSGAAQSLTAGGGVGVTDWGVAPDPTAMGPLTPTFAEYRFASSLDT